MKTGSGLVSHGTRQIHMISLFATPVPATSGVASIFQNGADVQNRGAEITVGAAIITGKDFTWDLDLNWSKNTSEVLKIAEGFDVLSFGSDFHQGV